jgi:hypothetical protein
MVLPKRRSWFKRAALFLAVTFTSLFFFILLSLGALYLIYPTPVGQKWIKTQVVKQLKKRGIEFDYQSYSLEFIKKEVPVVLNLNQVKFQLPAMSGSFTKLKIAWDWYRFYKKTEIILPEIVLEGGRFRLLQKTEPPPTPPFHWPDFKRFDYVTAWKALLQEFSLAGQGLSTVFKSLHLGRLQLIDSHFSFTSFHQETTEWRCAEGLLVLNIEMEEDKSHLRELQAELHANSSLTAPFPLPVPGTNVKGKGKGKGKDTREIQLPLTDLKLKILPEQVSLHLLQDLKLQDYGIKTVWDLPGLHGPLTSLVEVKKQEVSVMKNEVKLSWGERFFPLTLNGNLHAELKRSQVQALGPINFTGFKFLHAQGDYAVTMSAQDYRESMQLKLALAAETERGKVVGDVRGDATLKNRSFNLKNQWTIRTKEMKQGHGTLKLDLVSNPQGKLVAHLNLGLKDLNLQFQVGKRHLKMVRGRGQIVMEESFQSEWHDGRITRLSFDPSIKRNPFERADHDKLSPYLREDSGLTWDAIIIDGERLGPLALDFSVKQNILLIPKLRFDLGKGQGEIEGAFFLNIVPPHFAQVGLMARLSNLETVKIYNRLFGKKLPVTAGAAINARASLQYDLFGNRPLGKIDISKLGQKPLLAILEILDPEYTNDKINRVRNALNIMELKQASATFSDGKMDIAITLKTVALGIGISRDFKLEGFPISQMLAPQAYRAQKMVKKIPLR